MPTGILEQVRGREERKSTTKRELNSPSSSWSCADTEGKGDLLLLAS